MGNYVYGLGDEEPATLDLIARRTAEIIERQRAEESRRKWTLLFTVSGALFAAIKLGIVALPKFRARRGGGDAEAAKALIREAGR